MLQEIWRLFYEKGEIWHREARLDENLKKLNCGIVGLKRVKFNYAFEEFKLLHSLNSNKDGFKSIVLSDLVGLNEVVRKLGGFTYHLSCASDFSLKNNSSICLHDFQECIAYAFPGISYKIQPINAGQIYKIQNGIILSAN